MSYELIPQRINPMTSRPVIDSADLLRADRAAGRTYVAGRVYAAQVDVETELTRLKMDSLGHVTCHSAIVGLEVAQTVRVVEQLAPEVGAGMAPVLDAYAVMLQQLVWDHGQAVRRI